MYGYLKQWYNPKPLWIRLMPTMHTWYGHGSISIFLQYVHFRLFYVSILLFPTPLPHTNMANFPSIVGVFDHTHIWKVSGCSNHGPTTFWFCGSLMILLGMEIWHLAKMQCLCSGDKNKVSMRDHDPWFIPYGYGLDDWVVFWCTMLVLEPKEKLKLFKISITKLHCWRYQSELL